MKIVLKIQIKYQENIQKFRIEIPKSDLVLVFFGIPGTHRNNGLVHTKATYEFSHSDQKPF